MNFKDLLLQAKAGDDKAITGLLLMYRPLLLKESIGDIAERFGFTESKIKNMLFYTRNKLRDYLIKEGVEI